ATLVEKPLGDDCRLRRHIAQHRAPFERVLNQLLGAGEIKTTFLAQPTYSPGDNRQTAPSLHGHYAGQTVADLFAQFAKLLREFRSARRSFSTPERYTGRRAVCIFHQHARRSCFNPPNTPRSIAEQHYISSHALNSKIFIDGSNRGTVRLSDDGK